MQKFLTLLEPDSMSSILLDIGGYPGNWTCFQPCFKRLDILNLHKITFDSLAFPAHKMHTIIGNGCGLTFKDNTYDIVFSNSVIEHLENWENQKMFANEARRVGKSIWIQTPAKEFFIEPHYLAPFVHWLPKNIQKKLLRNFTLQGWITRPSKETVDKLVDTIRLLSKKEIQELFPDCQIIEEKFWFFTKSYIACKKAE